MYENVTFESILQRMLDRVSDQLDKRESSPVYNALAPAAVELQLMYIEFDIILKETFGDTASREYLIRRAAERGIIPYPATYALLKGEFTPTNINIPIGSRFSLNDLNYYIKEKISDGVYQVECEESGVKGNQYFGEMIPIEYIDGLETAQLTELLIPGEDEEDTEDLRTRYFSSFETKAYGGNQDDYLQKTNAIAGVGSTKITPLWDGGGTVKLTILNSEFSIASSTLIDTVQQEIDPTKDGFGIGIAPIGHIVTVNTAEEITVNVSSTITFDDDYSFATLQSQIESVVDEYLLELRKEWANQTNLIVRTAQIDTRILGIQGVIDIADTKINNVASNLTLSEYQIPMMGGVTG
ncbi:baseplate J/gp47 family protein [Tepidibacter hydrothermalis]|uniref:Baseplate J/gp47 family protein n=1 Tax=Tepidibacter hydrothermalis TaxID=3036126 RepID=A0ABY8EGY0_9FIRM|nr:baseplate J/gp47 family protein [Tepidibacter hydrothermalis]WFD12201.1 baseplate J/gp47 family protein [Tepidibacter hydrothermalis]